MMQQVATSKTNIASPAAVQDNSADNQQQGREFANIFKQQERKEVIEKTPQGTIVLQNKTETNKADTKSAELDGDNQLVTETDTSSAQASEKEAGNAAGEHDCEDCKHHQQAEESKEAPAGDNATSSESSTTAVGNNTETETTESDDLLSLLQASQAADIKHNKVTQGEGEKVELPVEPVVEPVVSDVLKNKPEGEQSVTQASHVDLTKKALTPELQQLVTELSAELQLSQEQQGQLSSLVQQLANKTDGGESSKLQKADVKLLATLMGGQNNNTELTQLSSKVENKELAGLLNLPEEKADKVISQLAAMLGQSNKSQSGNDGKVDFVASLKAGLAEIKQQLQQGHEPGIDLKSLIQQAMSKTTDAEVQIKPEQLTQSLQKLTQALEVTTSREQTSTQALSALASDRSLTVESQIRSDAVRQTSQQSLQSQMDRPVNILRPEGHQQLANKVQMMVNQKNMVADIRLDPPDLGSMTIKINMQGDQASVSFVVQSQQAQNTLEQSAPRLREMLAERGIELGQSSVQQDNPGKQAGKEGEQQLAGQNSQAEVEDMDEPENMHIHTRVVNGAVGGIDFFA